MKLFPVVELVLLVGAFYVVLNVEGTAKMWVSLPCLMAVLIMERVQRKREKEEEAAKRLENFSAAKLKRKMAAGNPPKRDRNV